MSSGINVVFSSAKSCFVLLRYVGNIAYQQSSLFGSMRPVCCQLLLVHNASDEELCGLLLYAVAHQPDTPECEKLMHGQPKPLVQIDESKYLSPDKASRSKSSTVRAVRIVNSVPAVAPEDGSAEKYRADEEGNVVKPSTFFLPLNCVTSCGVSASPDKKDREIKLDTILSITCEHRFFQESVILTGIQIFELPYDEATHLVPLLLQSSSHRRRLGKTKSSTHEEGDGSEEENDSHQPKREVVNPAPKPIQERNPYMDILSGGAHTGLTVASSDAIALSSSSPRTASPSQKGTPMPTWFPSIPHATWKQATASFAATKVTESEGRSNGIDDEDDDRNSSQYSTNASSVRRGTRDAASERFAQQAKQMEEMRRELEQLKKREATAKEESRLTKEKTSHQDPIDSLRLQPMNDDYAKDVNAVLDQLLKPPPTRRPPPVEKELTARPTSVGFAPQSVSPIADDRHNFPSLPRNDVDPLWFRYGVHSDSKIKPFHRQYDQHDLGAAAMAVQHGPFGRQSSTIAREEGINAMDDAALASSVSDKQFSEAVRNHYPTAIETRQTSFNPSDSLTSPPATQLRPSTSPAVMNTKDTKSKPVHRVTHVPPNTLLSGSPSLHQEEPTTPLFLKQDAFPNSTVT